MFKLGRCHEPRGVVLALALIFLCAFSLLAMTTFTLSQVNGKMATYHWQQKRVFWAAENGLRQIEQLLVNGELTACLHPVAGANAFIYRPSAWWRSAATCRLMVAQGVINYRIESLALLPCSQVRVVAKTEADELTWIDPGAQLYRITLQATLTDLPYQTRLQSIYAIPATTTIPCQHALNYLSYGRQSWRVLTVAK